MPQNIINDIHSSDILDNNSHRKNLIATKKINISCIVPVYNESSGIENFIQQLDAKLQTLSKRYEIIIVDDGSHDETPEIIEKLCHYYPIKFIKLSRNFGKETALTAGIENCNTEVSVLIDSDFQHPLDVIDQFLQHWAEGYDMVYGVRENRDNETLAKRIFTKCFYSLMHKITSEKIVPNAGDFRLLDQKVINSLHKFSERARFMKGLYAWVGYKSKAIFFNAPDRSTGNSSWNFSRLAELAITGITSFSNVPLRVWSLIGATITGISFSYALFLIIKTLYFGRDIPGYASIMVAILFFGGVQLLSIGILGEYIARIFNEVKKRPKYIISKKIGF